MHDEKFDDAAMEHEREQQWEHNQRKGKNVSKKLSDRMAESTSDRAYLYAGEVCDLEAELEAAAIRASDSVKFVESLQNEVRRLGVKLAAAVRERDTLVTDSNALYHSLIAERDAARLATLRECLVICEHSSIYTRTLIQALIDAEVTK